MCNLGTSEKLDRPVVLSGAFVEQLTERPALEDFGERTLKGKSQSQTMRVFGLTA